MSITKRIFYFSLLSIVLTFLHLEVILDIHPVWLRTHEIPFIFIELIIWLFIILLFIKISRYDFFEGLNNNVVFFTRISWRKLVFTLGMFSLAILIGYFDDHYNMTNLPENQRFINQYYLQVPLLVSVSNYLFAPTVEELLFRGLFFKMFFPNKTKLNLLLKITISGIVFGFAHQFTIDINWFIYCSMGWILSITYYYTEEMAYPILLHLLVNLI